MLLKLFVLLYPLGSVCGTEFLPLYQLHKTVTEGYNPHIRPIKDPGMATNVTVDFSLFSVEEVDEAGETLTTFGTFSIKWYDELLVWNLSDHANIRRIIMPLDHVWKPDLGVTNTVEDFRLLSDTEGLVSVTSTGFVSWYRTIRQITRCSMDMSKFPIDTQTCSLRVIQWISNNSEVFIQGGSVKSNHALLQSQGEWIDIENRIRTETHSFEGAVSQNEIWFTFTFQRKPIQLVISSVLPVFLLSVLNLGVFLLPPESGEKISLCISVFLSYALILTDIKEDLPYSPNSLAIFEVYLLTMLLVKVITIISTVTILKRHHTEMHAHQQSSSSSQEMREGNSSTLDERKERCYKRKLSADALNRVCFAVNSLIMITGTLTSIVFVLI